MVGAAFRSKMDAWLVVLLLAAAALSLAAVASVLMSRAPNRWLVAVASLTLGAALPLWVLLQTRYRMSESQLYVRSGPFTWNIAIGDIRGISSSRDAVASPALSLDRLRIDYGRDRFVLISPEESARFVLELEQRRRAVNAVP